MKKRILSALLAVFISVMFIPTSVSADSVYDVGDENIKYALDDTAYSVFRLINNIIITQPLEITREVTLDLNGYMLEKYDSGSVFVIKDGGHLTITDSNPTTTYKFKDNGSGLWVFDSDGDKVVHGGVIIGGTGLTDKNSVYGGGVYIDDGGQFTMIGGNIVGCTATGNNAYGGGVFVSKNSTFTMTGGSIAGCTAMGNFACGGGIRNDGEYNNSNVGRTTLSGTAVIRDCHAKGVNQLYGGGISDAGTLTISGAVKIIGCTAGKTISDAMYINANNGSSITGGTIYGRFYVPGNRISGITVKYHLNNDENYATQVVQSGDTISIPDPVKSGCTFDGWYKDGTKWDKTTPVTESLTLTGCLYASATTGADLKNALDDTTIDIIRIEKNITLDGITGINVTIGRRVTLDLNGYVLDLGKKTILVGGLTSSTMTVIDSRPTAVHKFTDTDGLWVSDKNGNKTVKGGVIANGGGINIDTNGTVIMNGGNIVGCTADEGGGVYVLGSFTMNGGSITGCVAEECGGGVYVLGTFTMNSGSIIGCTADEGGGVNARGVLTMNGGEIKNCTAKKGGALYLYGTMNAGGGTVDGTVVLDTKPSGSKGCIQNIQGSKETEFKGDVTNIGLIDSGKFFGKVTVGNNGFEGIIRNGIFNGPVTTVSAGGRARITGGTFNDTVTFDRGTITRGTFNGDVEVKETEGIPDPPTISGGTYNGLIKNFNPKAEFNGVHSPLGIVGTEPKAINGHSYHKVTFNTAGGTMNYTERYFCDEKLISEDISAIRDGYVFSGWFKSDGSKWDHSKDNVTSDITLTAHWSKNLSNGSGTESDPYRISSAEELKAFRDIVDGKNGQVKNNKVCAVLEKDIVLNEGTFDENGIYSLSNSGSKPEKWEPIGDYPNAFEGKFDGNGHTVYGVYINTSGNRLGLFGNIKGAEIKNLSVTGYISEGHYTGGIAGYAEASVISNCKNHATIEAYSGSEACAGGIVGYINGAGSNITNCENHGTVISKVTEQDAYAGGITGYLIVSKNCGISGCANFGTIKGADRENDLEALYVGGIVGYSLSGKISDSYNAGKLKNISVNRYKDSSVGGIAGYFANSVISDCYSVGKITANNSVKIGGIAGKTSDNIENCYYLSGLAKNAVGEIISGSPAINANAKSAREFADGSVLNALINGRTGNDNPWDSEGCKPVNDTDDTEIPVLAWQKLSIRHHGGTANCTQKAVCAGCGRSYGNIDPLNHNPSGENEWIKTPLTHERKWSCCDLISVKEENHNFKDAKCLDCEYECLHKDTLDLVKENGKYYYKCSVCDYETDKNDAPVITQGNGISITFGDKKPLIFRSTAPINEFIRVELDGETLDKKYYSKKEGSTIITLNEDFVSTLSVGTHTLSIVSVGGTATAEFTVNAPVVKAHETSPKTGYSEVFLALLSVAFLFGSITYKSLKKIKL